MEEITPQNIDKVDVKKISLNKEKLGALIFESSYSFTKELQNLFSELDELGYSNSLTPNEITMIDQAKVAFVGYLNRLSQFEISQPDAKTTHDAIESEITNFRNTTISQLRPVLTALRQEASFKKFSKKELEKEIKDTSEAKRKYDDLSKQLHNELENLQKRKLAVESAHGEVASKQLANYFSKQSNDYSNETKNWLNTRSSSYKKLITLIVLNYLLYLTLLMSNLFGWLSINVNFFFTPAFAVINLSLVTLLFYGLRFATQNYNIFSNLEAISRHRKNVAQTLEDFLATNPDNETRSEMIKQGTEAMFKHLPTGYIPKSERDTSPVNEVINYFLKKDIV